MILLLCGYRGCGKDTFANYISDRYHYTHKKISKPLKDGLKSIFDFNDEQIEGKLKDVIDTRWGITPRDAMIYLGTDVFQYHIQRNLTNIGRNFWIKQLEHKITKENDSLIVISDLRFWHELQYLKDVNKHEIKVIKIYNPDLYIFQKNADKSETEHLEFKYDFIVKNENTEEYFRNIDNVMNIIENANSN